MLIAFLVLLGVDLIVVVGLIALLLARRRWVKRRPGAFAGAIRLTGGEVDGFGSKWKRGYGRWVRDVLVWTKAPLFLQNELVPIDRVGNERPAGAGEVKRLGDGPVVIAFQSDQAEIEVAARAQHRSLVTAGAFDSPQPHATAGRSG